MSVAPFTDPRDGRRALLSLIHDGHHLTELRYRDEHGHWQKRWALTPESGDEIAASLTPRGHDVYVGLAPRLGSKGDAQRRYAPVRVLWADCDTARSVHKLREFEPEPTLAIASGGVDEGVAKQHAYWLLREPLAADTARVPLRRLAAALEADSASAEPAHILRLPGSRNHKTGRIAVAVRWTAEVHEIEALLAGLPEEPTTTSARTAFSGEPLMVPVGQRHRALVSWLGLCRSAGFGEAALVGFTRVFLDTTVQIDEERCPLDRDHAIRTARDIAARYPARRNNEEQEQA